MVHKEMVTVKNNVHGTVAIGAKDKNVSGPKGIEHGGVWMTEQVVPAAGNERHARLDGIEERRSRRRAAAVMRYLENIGTNGPSCEQRLGLAFRIPGEQRRSPFRGDVQDDGAIVFGSAAERAIRHDGAD